LTERAQHAGNEQMLAHEQRQAQQRIGKRPDFAFE
jgi:hypothetical protein